jgi:hypothetical protein
MDVQGNTLYLSLADRQSDIWMAEVEDQTVSSPPDKLELTVDDRPSTHDSRLRLLDHRPRTIIRSR